MIARLIVTARALVSDRNVQSGQVEMRIALAQAALVGVPVVLIGLAFMAVLP
jgi:hypothetical protein